MGNDARGAAEARSEGSLAVESTKASLRGSVLKDVSGNQPEAGCGWERVFWTDRPGPPWYPEEQAVSP